MTGDFRLARRLIRGAGARDLARLGMMAIGIALSVLALMIAVAVPRALAGAADRDAARRPVWGDPRVGAAVLTVGTSTTAVNGTPWMRVRFEGGDGQSPVPPGLTHLPASGHTIISPALRQLFIAEPERATGLGIIDVQTIGAPGLARPDELLSYSSLEPSATTGATPAKGPGTAVVAFGSHPWSGGSALQLAMEALLLVAAPALLFLYVCARLSVASRLRRLASLRLIGVSRDKCARIFSSELTLVSATGGALGLLLYMSLAAWLSRGALGMEWFASDTRLNPVLAVAVLLACCWGTSVIARRAMTRMLRAHERSTSPKRLGALVIGLALILVGGGFLSVVVFKVALAAPNDSVLSPAVHVPLVMGACLLSMIGLLVALPTAAAGVGQWLSNRDIGVSLRLGARLASTQTDLSARLVSALMATVMAAGLSAAFLRSTYLDALGDPLVATLSVDLADAAPGQRTSLAKELTDSAEIFVVGQLADGSGQQAYIHVTTCGRYVETFSQPGAHCTNGPVRIGADGAADTLPAGAKITIAQVGQPDVTVEAPDAAIGGVGGMTLVVPRADAPWAILSPHAHVTLTVPADQAAPRQAALQAAAPDAVVEQRTKDPQSLARYIEQSALLRSSLTLAYLLCLLTFMVSMVEAHWTNERSLVAQRALGIPTTVTRRATAVQFSLAVVLGSLVAVPVTAASGIAFLAFWGAHNAKDFGLWLPSAFLALGGVAFTLAIGWLLGRGTLRLALLEDNG